MRAGRWAYLIGLHALLILLLWKTDAIDLARRRLGLWSPQEMDLPWTQALARHRALDEQLPPGVVLFIGDSLIQGMEITRFGRRAANYGIGFDTTVGVLARLAAYPSLSHASTVVLLIGINDLMYHRDAAAIAANHRTILARLATVPRVVAVGLLPVNEDRATPRNAALRAINAELQRTCAAQRNCRYLDAWPFLIEAGDRLAPVNDRGDGLHLSPAGYDRLAAAIAPALAP